MNLFSIITFLFFYIFFTNVSIDANNVNNKICVNCKHFINVPLCSKEFGRCRLYPKNIDNYIEYDYLVTGKRKTEYRFCSFVREDINSCGISGKDYIPKMVLFPRLKKLKNKILNNELNPIIFLSNLETKQQEEKLEEKKEKDLEKDQLNDSKIIDIKLDSDSDSDSDLNSDLYPDYNNLN